MATPSSHLWTSKVGSSSVCGVHSSNVIIAGHVTGIDSQPQLYTFAVDKLCFCVPSQPVFNIFAPVAADAEFAHSLRPPPLADHAHGHHPGHHLNVHVGDGEGIPRSDSPPPRQHAEASSRAGHPGAPVSGSHAAGSSGTAPAELQRSLAELQQQLQSVWETAGDDERRKLLGMIWSITLQDGGSVGGSREATGQGAGTPSGTALHTGGAASPSLFKQQQGSPRQQHTQQHAAGPQHSHLQEASYASDGHGGSPRHQHLHQHDAYEAGSDGDGGGDGDAGDVPGPEPEVGSPTHSPYSPGAGGHVGQGGRGGGAAGLSLSFSEAAESGLSLADAVSEAAAGLSASGVASASSSPGAAGTITSERAPQNHQH